MIYNFGKIYFNLKKEFGVFKIENSFEQKLHLQKIINSREFWFTFPSRYETRNVIIDYQTFNFVNNNSFAAFTFFFTSFLSASIMLTGQIYTDETLLADHVVCVFTLRHVACRGLLHTFRQTREARCKYAADTI